MIKKTSSIFNKKNSIGLGFGTNKTFNILQCTYNLKLSKNFSIYGLLGFGNLYGLGFAWQQNYNENCLMVGWSRGIALNENAFGSFFCFIPMEIKRIIYFFIIRNKFLCL